MVKQLCVAVGLAVLLAACGQSTSGPPAQRVSFTLSASAGVAGLSGSGQRFHSPIADLTVLPAASPAAGQVSVEVNPAAPPIAVPPVDEVNSSFIMSAVPDKVYLGAWRVRASTPGLMAVARLLLKGASPAPAGSVTETFVQDNTDGHVVLVSSFRDDQPFSFEDFGDRLSELERRGKRADLTFFAYRSSWTSYSTACLALGGGLEFGYCSFANKRVVPKLGAQQSLGMYQQVWSSNWGNVAQSCGAYTQGANYQYKLCYQSTERRVSDALLAIERNRKPDILLIQETWMGDCRYTPESTYGTSINPRLCAPNTAGTPAINRVLGFYGSRYKWDCTNTQVIPSQNLVVNGYECVAWNPMYWDIVTREEFHPNCETADPNVNYRGRDTGFHIVGLRSYGYNGGGVLKAVTAHLAGTDDPNCRATQINALASLIRGRAPAFYLLGGDFNTDPLNDSTAGGNAFRSAFAGSWGTPAGAIGTLVDDPRQPTASYVGGYTPSLDHVITNAFTGGCSRGGSIDGLDHIWTLCNLSDITP